ATRAWALTARLRLIYSDGAVAQHCAIQAGDSVACGLVICHLYKPEALALIGASVNHHGRLDDLSKRAKQLRKLLIARVVGQVPYVNAGSHSGSFGKCRLWLLHASISNNNSKRERGSLDRHPGGRTQAGGGTQDHHWKYDRDHLPG